MKAGQPVDPFSSLEEALQQLIEDLDKIGTLPADPGENPDNEDPFFDERAQIMATVATVAYSCSRCPNLPARSGSARWSRW